MKVRKAVLTAAGWGTRFLPATKAQPKEMLPLVDKPMIQYAVEEVAASGIRQVICVTASGKRAIEDHFDRSMELERWLEEKGEKALAKEMRRISELVDIAFVRQNGQRGLGHAVLSAKYLVGYEPFAVVLPDDIIDADVPALAQMLEVYTRVKTNVIAVERVPMEEVGRYGVIQAEQVGERLYKVSSLVEKPERSKAPSNLAVIGRYVLNPEVFLMLEKVKPGAQGEIQLTDGLEMLRSHQEIYAFEFEGKRYDGGTPLGLLRASVEMALNRPDLGPPFREFLRWLDVRGRHAKEREPE